MDPEKDRAQSRRPSQDAEHLSSRNSNRLFLSETIPPSAPSHTRSHNLSDKIHDYYEKLLKNSQLNQLNVAHQSHQFPSRDRRFVENYGTECNPMSSRHQPGTVRTTFQPASGISSCSAHPYTVFVEDPTGAFQRHRRKKSNPTEDSRPSYFEDKSHKEDMHRPFLSRTGRENSKSPTDSMTVKRVECSSCLGSNHAPQSCTLLSRLPAEQERFFSDPPIDTKASEGNKSASSSSVESQGDDSEKKEATMLCRKKRAVPPNISVRCQRDIIGQEKSPVLKTHPIGSAVLSSSSSNGDSVPRERKKWVRPPLVGQASSTADSSPFINPVVFDHLDVKNDDATLFEKKTPEESLQLSSSTGSDQTETRNSGKGLPQQKSSYFDTISDGNSYLHQGRDSFFLAGQRDLSLSASQQATSEGEQALSDSCAGGRVSPSSSVTSNRRLEWDSGADVGYNQMYNSPNPEASTSGLCTIERMALAQGCSVALQLRLDPEGTTVPASSSGVALTILPSPLGSFTPGLIGKPAAESTPVDQLPHGSKALLRCKSNAKNTVSPILITKETEKQLTPAKPVTEEKKGSVNTDLKLPKSSFGPVQRHMSNSMQDLRKGYCKKDENQLLKSQSDPDLSGDSPTLVSKTAQSKYLRAILKSQSYVTGNSISSGSDATLVHVGTEEDIDVDSNGVTSAVGGTMELAKDKCVENYQGNSEVTPGVQIIDHNGKQTTNSEIVATETNEQDCKSDKSLESASGKSMEKNELAPCQSNPIKGPSIPHICSDIDHKRGLHHHFGVLCSTVLGSHGQSSAHPVTASLLHQTHPQNQQSTKDSSQFPLQQESEVLTGESTGSSAFHSDAAHEENVRGSRLTGRANSFEYLPGHMYEKNSGQVLRSHERPPGISTSTETDSEPARSISRLIHPKVTDSSSHDTEDDRLWASPRVGSNTLVRDIERGVSLLKGVMENKSAGRRCKRELIRRIIKKIVTSDYVEDFVEREKPPHHARSPFSPKKSKYQLKFDRNLRSRKPVGSERQEISGESDEPKQRILNTQKKISLHQTLQGHGTSSTYESGSKSSSLMSSHAESTNGSITLSGSSDCVSKEKKTSVKSNPIQKEKEEQINQAAEWLRPATHSEKLFEMRKSCVSHAEKHLAGLVEKKIEDPNMDPMIFSNDPHKQLCWVKSEINQLKILKQLLQKQETLKQNVNLNFCQPTLVTMPLTGLHQTMQMADCTSPDIPEAHSPKPKSSRMRQWISLESDTSAGLGLSNNTESSQDSNWQEVEVASAGQHDSQPHRTVSISDGEQVTDSSCSLTDKNSGSLPKSYPQRVQKSRQRLVNISDVDEPFLPPSADIPIQRKRSESHPVNHDGRTFTSRTAEVSTYGPPPRNLPSDRYVKQLCNCHTAESQKVASFPVEGQRTTTNNPGEQAPTNPAVPMLNQKGKVLGGLMQGGRSSHLCSCANANAQTSNSCSCGPHPSEASLCTGAVRKGTANLLQKNQANMEESPIAAQNLSGGGLVRIHIETNQPYDSSREMTESQRSSTTRDKVSIVDVSEDNRVAMMRLPSTDSITKAVTEAVSSKVKAFRNVGKIEEAEVKIRLKVGQGLGGSRNLGQSDRGKLMKSQDLEEEHFSLPSKQTEMDDMIARQRAMDIETRQKLLAIAESRQRAQMGMLDIDRKIQDLLLQDYLSRQLKTSDTVSSPQPHLNVRADDPLLRYSSVGVQSEVDRKTTGTSTGAQIQGDSYMRNEALLQQESVSVEQPVRDEGQQTETISLPQTYPPYCQCSCQSAPASSPRTYKASSVLSSPRRQIEFELELRKQQPYKFAPHEIHETLKQRNTAYFLQFEEDTSVLNEHEEPVKKPPMEVVTVKIPKNRKSSSRASSSNQLSSSNRPGSASGKNLKKKQPFSEPDRTKGFLKSSNAEPQSTINTKQTIQSDFAMDSQHQNQSIQRESGSPSNVKTTPRTSSGRSHLSITVTDSSADSIQSPDGNSEDSSHPSRKPHKSPQSSKKRHKNLSTEGCKSVSSTLSALNLSGVRQNRPHQIDEVESMLDFLGDVNSVPTLQEYLEKNHPKYLDAAEKRRRCIAEMAYLRRLRQQSRKRLLELEGDRLRSKQKQQWRSRCVSRSRSVPRRKPAVKTTKSASTRRYMFLPESQQRLAELKKKEEKKTNRLMAEIYTRKLQEKVLKGSTTIRSSVSVISSL